MPPVVRAQLDYYALLQITPAADTAEVNAAFRRLAWLYHPDRNHAPGATLQFQDINEAHQVLSDCVRRAEYDDRWHRRPTRHVHVTPPPARHRYRRRWRRHRHVRVVLLAIGALMFVSSAWAVIFTAMTAAHSAESLNSYGELSSAVSSAAPSCGFSMEIFPVSYRDRDGHIATAWETEVRNCFGGPTRVSNLSNSTPSARLAFDPMAQN